MAGHRRDDAGNRGISRRAAFRLAAAAVLGAGAVRGTAAVEHESPRRRPIPSSGEPVPVVGVGTWKTFDVGRSAEDRQPLDRLLERFSRINGGLVDTSPMYGRSERVVGEIAAKLGIRHRLFLATKVWTTGRAAGERQLEQSESALATKRLDLVQVHNLLDVGSHLPALRDLKAAGRIRYFGITHFSPDAYPEVERILRAERLDVLQINYSALEAESEARLLPLAADRGVAVVANRPFGGGELLRRLSATALPSWAAECDAASWPVLLLKWILAHPAVTCAIAGTGRVEHLEENLRAAAGRLPDAGLRRRIAAAVRES